MKALAGFVMRGYRQATLVAAAGAFLSLLVPFLGFVFGLGSSGTVALVTLRRGIGPGALVAAGGGALCALASLILFGRPWAALAVMAILWVPVWGLSGLLRFSRSLAFTAQAAGIAGVALVVLVHALVGDPSSYWGVLLEPARKALVEDGLMEAAPSQALFAELARWMTGTFAAILLLQLLAGVFIGRWWQALLYNPGGFGSDFRSFRLHPAFGVAGLVLLTLIAFGKGPGLVADLLFVLFPLWLLQGLAVIHYVHNSRKAAAGWLVALYLSMVFLMPHAELLVACMGLVDIWADIRARLGRRPFGES
jgi:hypothetical protein